MKKLSEVDKQLIKSLKVSVESCMDRLVKSPKLQKIKFQRGHVDEDGNKFYIEMRVYKANELPNHEQKLKEE